MSPPFVPPPPGAHSLPPPRRTHSLARALSLLLPCPNARLGDYSNNGGDAYVPNPACSSPEELRKFEFLGNPANPALTTTSQA